MKRALAGLMLMAVSTTVWCGDRCAGKVAAAILAHDRELRQGAGLLINHCGHPVRAEILVIAHNRDGFPVARLRTEVQAAATPMSVFQVDLPFVQSVILLSGYSTEVAAIESLDTAPERTARFIVPPLPVPLL